MGEMSPKMKGQVTPEVPDRDAEKVTVTSIDQAVVAAGIVKNYRPSRENSLALTKLEEAQFWADRDINRKEQSV